LKDLVCKRNDQDVEARQGVDVETRQGVDVETRQGVARSKFRATDRMGI